MLARTGLRRLARAAAFALVAGAAGCAGHDDGGAAAPQPSSAAAPGVSPTPFDAGAPLAKSATCFGSMAEASELTLLVTSQVRGPAPVVTGCVTDGTWALVRYRSPAVPIGTLFAALSGGHWTHVAHGPRVLSAKDMLLVSQIDATSAARLEKMEAKIGPEGSFLIFYCQARRGRSLAIRTCFREEVGNG